MVDPLDLKTTKEVQKFMFSGRAYIEIVRVDSKKAWVLALWPYGRSFKVAMVMSKMKIGIGSLDPQTLEFSPSYDHVEKGNPIFAVVEWLGRLVRTEAMPEAVSISGMGFCGKCGRNIDALYCAPHCGISPRYLRSQQRKAAMEREVRAVEEFYPKYDGPIDDTIN